MSNRIKTISSLIILLSLLNAGYVSAQSNGRLKGRVSDVLGGAIANNKLVIQTTASSFQTVTNENGEFDIELPAGVYRVSTEKIKGFIPFNRERVEIKSDKITAMNIRLKVTLDDAICILWFSARPEKKTKALKSRKN